MTPYQERLNQERTFGFKMALDLWKRQIMILREQIPPGTVEMALVLDLYDMASSFYDGMKAGPDDVQA